MKCYKNQNWNKKLQNGVDKWSFVCYNGTRGSRMADESAIGVTSEESELRRVTEARRYHDAYVNGTPRLKA